MQIYEITKPDPEHLDEVVGGLARMAGQAIAGSKLGQAVGQAAGAVKQGFQQSAVGQTLQKAGDVQQQAKLAGSIGQMSNLAYQQWNKKKLALLNAAGGQPIENEEAHLADFVQKTLLNNRQITDLDPPSQRKIEAAITNVMTAGNDRRKLQQAFTDLVTQSTAARQDPAKQTQQKVSVDNMITTLANRGVSKTGNIAVDQLLSALGIPLK